MTTFYNRSRHARFYTPGAASTRSIVPLSRSRMPLMVILFVLQLAITTALVGLWHSTMAERRSAAETEATLAALAAAEWAGRTTAREQFEQELADHTDAAFRAGRLTCKSGS